MAEPPNPVPPSLLDRISAGRLRVAPPTLAAALFTALGMAVAIWAGLHPASRSRAAPVRILPAEAPAPPAPTDIVALLGTALPPGSSIAELAASPQLTAIIETTDPEALRAALRAAPRLSRLRTIAETGLPDAGYRVTLEERR